MVYSSAGVTYSDSRTWPGTRGNIQVCMGNILRPGKSRFSVSLSFLHLLTAHYLGISVYLPIRITTA